MSVFKHISINKNKKADYFLLTIMPTFIKF